MCEPPRPNQNFLSVTHVGGSIKKNHTLYMCNARTQTENLHRLNRGIPPPSYGQLLRGKCAAQGEKLGRYGMPVLGTHPPATSARGCSEFWHISAQKSSGDVFFFGRFGWIKMFIQWELANSTSRSCNLICRADRLKTWCAPVCEKPLTLLPPHPN